MLALWIPACVTAAAVGYSLSQRRRGERLSRLGLRMLGRMARTGAVRISVTLLAAALLAGLAAFLFFRNDFPGVLIGSLLVWLIATACAAAGAALSRGGTADTAPDGDDDPGQA